jgi:hypothetical protein
VRVGLDWVARREERRLRAALACSPWAVEMWRPVPGRSQCEKSSAPLAVPAVLAQPQPRHTRPELEHWLASVPPD